MCYYYGSVMEAEVKVGPLGWWRLEWPDEVPVGVQIQTNEQVTVNQPDTAVVDSKAVVTDASATNDEKWRETRAWARSWRGCGEWRCQWPLWSSDHLELWPPPTPSLEKWFQQSAMLGTSSSQGSGRGHELKGGTDQQTGKWVKEFYIYIYIYKDIYHLICGIYNFTCFFCQSNSFNFLLFLILQWFWLCLGLIK